MYSVSRLDTSYPPVSDGYKKASPYLFRSSSDEEASGPLSIDLRAEYWRQDHTVKNGVKGPRTSLTRVTFSDFNQNGRVDVIDDPTTIENELEITQESHYYPFGLQQNGNWYTTVLPENKYLYNGKELSEDYGIDLYAYGFRYYDPAIGRFTGVDPIADQFPHLSTYNYASNDPIRNIDLHGLQGVPGAERMIRQQISSKLADKSGKPVDEVYNEILNAEGGTTNGGTLGGQLLDALGTLWETFSIKDKDGGAVLETSGEGNDTETSEVEAKNAEHINVDGVTFGSRVERAAKKLRNRRTGSKEPHDTVNQWSYRGFIKDTVNMQEGDHQNYIIRNEEGETIRFLFFKKED